MGGGTPTEAESMQPTAPSSTSSSISIAESKRYVGFTDEHCAVLRSVGDEMQAMLPAIIEQVYVGIRTVPELSEKLGSKENERRVSGLFAEYARQMFTAKVDDAYARSRERIGEAHERIGLGPQWYLATFGHMFRDMLIAGSVRRADSPDEMAAFLDAMLRIMFLDMGLVLQTYERVSQEHRQEMLDRFTGNLTSSTEALDAAVCDLEQVALDQAASSAQQAAAVSEVSASLSELRQTSANSLDKANELLSTAQEAEQAADRGVALTTDTVEGMQSIRQRVELIRERIQTLSDHTQQIGDIISTVNEIAEQSKLLALNASIEAARAGEFGRSFSVVANEMRDLAEQSKQATRQVRQLLSGIQDSTTAAVVATEEGMQRVAEGQDLTHETGEIIRELQQVVGVTLDRCRTIADASNQQGQGVAQVADAMTNIDAGLRSSSEGMTRMRVAVEAIKELGQATHGVLEEFTSGETTGAAMAS